MSATLKKLKDNKFTLLICINYKTFIAKYKSFVYKLLTDVLQYLFNSLNFKLMFLEFVYKIYQ